MRHAAESPWIAKAKLFRFAQLYDQVCVRPNRMFSRDDEELPRHAEVHQERPAIGFNDDPFAPATHCRDASAGQQLFPLRRPTTAERVRPNGHGTKPATNQMRSQLADYRFDFR